MAHAGTAISSVGIITVVEAENDPLHYYPEPRTINYRVSDSRYLPVVTLGRLPGPSSEGTLIRHYSVLAPAAIYKHYP